jgi:putative redox protein
LTRIELEYSGELRTQMTHVKSGEQIITDAPTDNHGRGEAFSPTDLVAASLLSCMVTVMGIHAEKRGMNMGQLSGSIEKTMVEGPRRVGHLNVKISFKRHNLSAAERQILEQIGINCPVALSLHPDVLQQVQFEYD